MKLAHAKVYTVFIHKMNATTDDARVVLNIGGLRFQTFRSTLARHKDTLLEQLSEDDTRYDADNCEYFFDRSPYLFQFILDYYRLGTLHFPHDICGPRIEVRTLDITIQIRPIWKIRHLNI